MGVYTSGGPSESLHGAQLCANRLEGIVAKQASARYTPEATTWVKIKNRQYSQAVGREDFFDHRRVNK